MEELEQVVSDCGKMTRNIVLTVTLASALTYASCRNDNGWMTDQSGNTYKEMKADSVRTHSGHSVYYFGGRPFIYGTTAADGTRFVPSESGKGGYFAKPGATLTPKIHASAPTRSTPVRGGFGSVGVGRSGGA